MPSPAKSRMDAVEVGFTDLASFQKLFILLKTFHPDDREAS